MRIRLGIVDTDEIYVGRLVSTLNRFYSDKLEIYSYTDMEHAVDRIGKHRHDIVLVDENLPVDEFKNCCVAYFVESSDIDQLNGKKAICKFQKMELIYKDILNLYAEYSAKAAKKKQSAQDAEIITFMSPVSGVGNTAVAAAFCINCALNNKSSIYVDLETLPSTDLYFGGESKYTMSDVIYAVKSKKANLSMKLESFVTTDPVGLDYFATPVNTMDLHELNDEDIELLLKELKAVGLYDYIVLDVNFGINNNVKKIMSLSDKMVYVTNLDEKSAAKMEKAKELINIYTKDETTFDKAYVVVNNNRTGVDDASKYNVVATIDHAEGFTARQIADQMANNQMLTKIY